MCMQAEYGRLQMCQGGNDAHLCGQQDYQGTSAAFVCLQPKKMINFNLVYVISVIATGLRSLQDGDSPQ